MASFSLGQIIDAKRMISPTEEEGSGLGAIDSETVDTQGAESFATITATGTVAGAAPSVQYYESNDSPVTIEDSNKVADSNVIEERPEFADTDNAVYVASIRPTKRYVRARVADREDDNIHISMVGVLGHLTERPVE